MKLVAKENLFQLKGLILKMKKENYTKETEILSGATVGQHIRHILEFYLILVSGSFSGVISYDKRKRDLRIENDADFAKITIDNLLPGIDALEENAQVNVEGDYSAHGDHQNFLLSSVGRELAYCIEHSIHHQALIKAALIFMRDSDLIDEHFGVAYSTIRYRNEQCAQ